MPDMETATLFRAIDERLAAGAQRMNALEERQAALQRELARNSEITGDIREILAACRLGLRVLGGLGQLVRWIGMVATAALAIWAVIYAIKSGTPLPPKH